MKAKSPRKFDPKTFLATIGDGRKILALEKDQTIFVQGSATDAVFYVQKGKVKLTVVSQAGKEATVGVLGEGCFFGEGGLAGQAFRMGSASAMTECRVTARTPRRISEVDHDLNMTGSFGVNVRWKRTRSVRPPRVCLCSGP